MRNEHIEIDNTVDTSATEYESVIEETVEVAPVDETPDDGEWCPREFSCESVTKESDEYPEFVDLNIPGGFTKRYVNEEVYNQNADALQKLQNAYDKLDTDRLMALADIQNMRRRYNNEQVEARKNQDRHLLEVLIPFFNNMFASVSALRRIPESEQTDTGLLRLWDELKKTLEKTGIEILEPQIGDEFDLDTMAAVTSITSEDENTKPNTVAICMSPAYKLNGKVVKYANVGVYAATE